MKSLFVDTTSDLIVGLLDENWQWIFSEVIQTNKTSAALHPVLENKLKQHKIDKSDIDRYIYMAGPGSYTGMRIAEGVAQVFNWQGIKLNSFYHYEVPCFLEIQDYIWYANAYKREYFIHESVGGEGKSFLVKSDEWDELDKDEDKLFNHQKTSELILDDPEKIFKYIVGNNIQRELLYYRNLEDEFKKAAK